MRALVTGASGMDASYLMELLLEKGYEVYGLVRVSSTSPLQRIEHLLERVHLIYGDIADQISLDRAVRLSQPDEVYHLGAQSFVGVSWTQPFVTLDITGLGTIRMLEALRKYKPDAKFYNAASSEMFGAVLETPQTETTPFNPVSPYGIAKLVGFHTTKNYRDSYGMFACSGIAMNHESSRRGLDFVTRKITLAAARIKMGLQKELKLGNLDAIRDWGYAPDFVKAMWLMLQQEKPQDFVIATGQAHTVKEWLNEAFCCVGLNWRDYVIVDENFKRPAEVDILLGNASKAKRMLGWEPTVHFEEIVKKMVAADLALANFKA